MADFAAFALITIGVLGLLSHNRDRQTWAGILLVLGFIVALWHYMMGTINPGIYR